LPDNRIANKINGLRVKADSLSAAGLMPETPAGFASPEKTESFGRERGPAKSGAGCALWRCCGGVYMNRRNEKPGRFSDAAHADIGMRDTGNYVRWQNANGRRTL